MTTRHSIAVIIPCHNAERWLGRALESVSGTAQNIIVVDDGSTDDSRSVANSFAGAQLIVSENQGANHARNLGLASVTSDYVLFLDADDMIEASSLEAWTRVMHSSGVDMLCCPYANERDGIVGPSILPLRRKGSALLAAWFGGVYIPPCAIVWSVDFLRRIGGWRVGLRRNQDGELVMRALILSARVGWCDEGLGVYVQHDDPGRVSKRSSPDILLEQIDMFAELEDLARRQGLQLGADFFAPAFYGIACEAYNSNYADVGAAALAQARARGLRGHPGTWPHRLGASVLGLERKMRLAKWLRLVRGAQS